MEPRHIKIDKGSCQGQNWRTVTTISKIWITGTILWEPQG